MKQAQSDINNLVLLVGGLGTRLRSVVSEVPKPMAPIKNKPFLSYILEYWYDRGVKNFHLLVGYKGTVIEKHFGNKFKESKIFYYSEDELAGTGGALKLFVIKNKIINKDESFILMNGDTWLDVDILQLKEDFTKSKNELIIAVTNVPFNNRYGTLKIVNKHVTEISSPNNKEAIINSGLYLLTSEILLKYLNEQKQYKFSFEEDILPALMKDKKIKASFAIKFFLDIGVPEDLIKALDILKLNKYITI